MSCKQQASVWLLVFLVAVLFVLSVLAPREWRTVAISPVVLDAAPGMLAVVPEAPEGERLPAVPSFSRIPPLHSVRSVSEAPADSAAPPPAQLTTMATHPTTATLPDTAALPATGAAVEPLIEIWQPSGLAQSGSLELPSSELSSAATSTAIRERPEPEAAFVTAATDEPTLAFSSFTSDRRIVEIRPRVTRQYAAPEATEASPPPAESAPAEMATAGLAAADAAVPAEPLIPAIASRPTAMQAGTQALQPADPGAARLLFDRRLNEFSGNVITSWPYPQTLAADLEGLAEFVEAGPWCDEVRSCLNQLHAEQALASPPVTDALVRLKRLQEVGFQNAQLADDRILAAEWTRVAFALARRVSIWERVHAIGSQSAVSAEASLADDQRFCGLLGTLERRLGESRRGSEWRQYLLVEDAQQTFCFSRMRNSDEGRALAKQILLRMDHALLTPEQRAFLSQPEFFELAVELRQLAVEPVDYLRLLDVMERYEEEGKSLQSLHLAAAQMILRWSRNAGVAELGQQLNENYRNANLRVSVSTDLVNRLVPGEQKETLPVDDVIMGTPTVGCSETVSTVRVRCLPSPETWRLELTAAGEVVSETRSYRGPATLFSQGNAVFRAEKQLVVDPHGVRQSSTNAVADSEACLTGVSTNLDRVPLLGDLVQAVATQRYESQSRQAEQEVRNRVACHARTRFDDEVNQQLQQIASQFIERFYQPMETLALNPLALEMRTTHRRMIARYRLAGHHQLAANTPRPIAPSDSLLSLQIHQSALNNVIEQLDWQGRTIGLQQLYTELTERFRLGDGHVPEDFPEDVTLRFAAEDPVRFTLEDGRMAIEISLVELKQGRRGWKNFTVRVFYEPALDDPQADLVRDQYVELIGRRLSFRDQIALRGIFSRVFAKNQPMDFVSRRLQSDPRFDGLAVIQTVIQDGWLGIAIGPRNDALIAERSSLPALGTLR